jgi:hypothetical protein
MNYPGLGRLAQLRFQFRDPLGQRRDLRGSPLNVRRLLRNHIRLRQDQRDQVFLGKLGQHIAIHRIVESWPRSRVNHIYAVRRPLYTKSAAKAQGVSSYCPSARRWSGEHKICNACSISILAPDDVRTFAALQGDCIWISVAVISLT